MLLEVTKQVSRLETTVIINKYHIRGNFRQEEIFANFAILWYLNIHIDPLIFL